MAERIESRIAGQTDAEILASGRVALGDITILLKSGNMISLSDESIQRVLDRLNKDIQVLEGDNDLRTLEGRSRGIMLCQGLRAGILVSTGQIDANDIYGGVQLFGWGRR